MSIARKRQEVTYILTDADGAPAEEWRFTVGPLSMLDGARYQMALREGFAWAEGVDLPEDDPMRLLRTQLVVARARILAATQKVERKNGDGWEECELPEEWRTVQGFLTGVPGALAEEWHTAMRACNPGMFPAEDDDAKNAGGASATS